MNHNDLVWTGDRRPYLAIMILFCYVVPRPTHLQELGLKYIFSLE